MAAPVKVARQQTTPELSGTFQTLPPEPTLSGTLRNLPGPSGTNLSEPSGTYLQNLRIHRNPPKSSGTLRNLPPDTILHRNSPEPSGTCLRNLHQHTPEPSGTFRKLPLEPTWNPPEPSGSCLRNLPEPSGTCLRNLHQHTPELSGTFWSLPPEPAPQTRTGTHRSLSGLKTPLAYAVRENYTSIDPKQQQTMFPRCSCAIKKSLVAVFLRKETKEQGETRPGTEPGTRMNQKIMMEHNPLPEKGKKSRETSQGTLAGKRRKGKS